MSSMHRVAGTAGAARLWKAAGSVCLERLRDYLCFLIIAALLWQALILLLALPPYLLPSPALIAEAFSGHAGGISGAAGITLLSTLAGLGVAVLAASSLALVFMAAPLVSEALMPLIVVVRTLPMIAIAPLLVLLFGRGSSNSIGMVALLSFFQILLSARQGFEAPTRSMLELMRACGAGFWQTFFKLRVPAALPHLFTGLRIASASAILCAMFAEWLSGADGLGSLILDAYSRQDFSLMWASVLTGTSISYLFFTATMALERAVMDWNQ